MESNYLERQMANKSAEYIFKRNKQGELEFVGDFNGYYQSDSDPWQQKAAQGDMASYYQFSRQNLAKFLTKYQAEDRLFEVGCGLGHSSYDLQQHTQAQIVGVDISQVAIEKAKQNYPLMTFFCQDITQPMPQLTPGTEQPSYQAVIFNQVLWYIMYQLPQVLANCLKLVPVGGEVIFATAFLNNQQYGKEVFNGFDEFNAYLKTHWAEHFEITTQLYDDSDNFEYHDGITCLRRIA